MALTEKLEVIASRLEMLGNLAPTTSPPDSTPTLASASLSAFRKAKSNLR